MLTASPSGHVDLPDIERYLDDVMVSGVLPYRKLFDTSGRIPSRRRRHDDAGRPLSAYTGLGLIGALAIVAPVTLVREQARLFAALAPADRPLQDLQDGRGCRKWLGSQASGKPG